METWKLTYNGTVVFRSTLMWTAYTKFWSSEHRPLHITAREISGPTAHEMALSFFSHQVTPPATPVEAHFYANAMQFTWKLQVFRAKTPYETPKWHKCHYSAYNIKRSHQYGILQNYIPRTSPSWCTMYITGSISPMTSPVKQFCRFRSTIKS